MENALTLAAMAERAAGAALGADDFVLVWLGGGLGLATILGGQLHRGTAGGAGGVGSLARHCRPLHRATAGPAGEIGYLPVHGAPLPSDIRHPASGGFQWLAGGSAVRALAAS